MRKIFGFIVVAILAFPITACGRKKAGETGTVGGIETIPATDTMESVRETRTAPGDTGSEPAAEEETIIRAEFDFERRTVMLNSGYEMPINGLGTYSLHGDECINAVKSALSNGVRLIDTASAYGNEEEIGQAIREAIDEGIVQREDIFVTTKIYPGNEMEYPARSIQACLDRLDIGYVDLTMEQFVEEGKIRSIRLSNWYVEELTDFLPQVDTVPAVVQNVIPFIQDLGIVVQGWYPLGGRGHTGELLGDSVISEIAGAHGVSSAQVILRWNLQTE